VKARRRQDRQGSQESRQEVRKGVKAGKGVRSELRVKAGKGVKE
jgi:hypothetical protein